MCSRNQGSPRPCLQASITDAKQVLERDGESGRQNFGFYMKKIIDGYLGGSSSVYRGLGKPGSRDAWEVSATTSSSELQDSEPRLSASGRLLLARAQGTSEIAQRTSESHPSSFLNSAGTNLSQRIQVPLAEKQSPPFVGRIEITVNLMQPKEQEAFDMGAEELATDLDPMQLFAKGLNLAPISEKTLTF
ncbi:hypothetical protein U0070_019156 [Myodes glareolus]|uniref:Uncharacterized protein n=1 Tax=Myodes glareolus TaxID=447135 RepID=A0AAW0IM46_MYOGA